MTALWISAWGGHVTARQWGGLTLGLAALHEEGEVVLGPHHVVDERRDVP